MKKKILALVLCLILCVPFVLTSCFGGNKGNDQTPPPSLPELTTYELLGGKFEPSENYTSHTTTEVVGDVASQRGVLLSTTKSDLSLDEVELTTTYRVYNMELGTVVYSISTTYSYYSFEYTSLYDSVSITLRDDYFSVVKSNDDEQTMEVYSIGGSLLLSSDEENSTISTVYLDFISEPAFIFDNCIYKIEKTDSGDKATLVKDLEFATFNDYVEVQSLSNGNYIAIVEDRYSGETEDFAYILDSNFDVIKAIELYDDMYVPFGDADEDYFILNNGNILLQVKTELGEYSDVVASGIEYDFAVDGYCLTVDTYIIDTTTGERKAVDTPYIFEYVISRFDMEKYSDAVDFPFDFENIALLACKIENKRLVPVSESYAACTVVDNDLNVIGTYETVPQGYEDAEIISDGKYVLISPLSTELYNADGTLIKNIGDAEYNEKYIVTSKAVYDHNMQLVYSLENSELEISRVKDTCITFTKQDKETGNYLYYMLSGTSQEPTLFLTVDSNTQVYWKDTYYYTTVYTPSEGEDEAFITLSVYSNEGNLITSKTVGEDAYISASSSGGFDYVSISDDETLTVIVLK